MRVSPLPLYPPLDLSGYQSIVAVEPGFVPGNARIYDPGMFRVQVRPLSVGEQAETAGRPRTYFRAAYQSGSWRLIATIDGQNW